MLHQPLRCTDLSIQVRAASAIALHGDVRVPGKAFPGARWSRARKDVAPTLVFSRCDNGPGNHAPHHAVLPHAFFLVPIGCASAAG